MNSWSDKIVLNVVNFQVKRKHKYERSGGQISQLRSFGCLTPQQNVDFLFDPIFIVRSISIADFLVPKNSKNLELFISCSMFLTNKTIVIVS